VRRISLYIQSLFYIGAGVNHFLHPGGYAAIMPPWLPAPAALVLISGIAEIVLGALLLFPSTRKWAAWGIIILLILVFPANIQMAVNAVNTGQPPLWIAIVRLPVQLLLIYWAWIFTREKK
jgi:uncharacterized membrane protein